MSPSFNNLLRKAGSATYTYQTVEGISRHEYMLLTGQLAPIESDGAGDEDDWNLFEEYLEVDSVKDRDTLGAPLGKWESDVVSWHLRWSLLRSLENCACDDANCLAFFQAACYIPRQRSHGCRGESEVYKGYQTSLGCADARFAGRILWPMKDLVSRICVRLEKLLL